MPSIVYPFRQPTLVLRGISAIVFGGSMVSRQHPEVTSFAADLPAPTRDRAWITGKPEVMPGLLWEV